MKACNALCYVYNIHCHENVLYYYEFVIVASTGNLYRL